jgi:hypothetical protein
MEDLVGLNFSTATPKSAPPNQTRFSQNASYIISPVPSRGNYGVALPPTTNGNGSIPQSSLSSKPDSFALLSAFSGITRVEQQSNASLEQQRLAKKKERREAQEKEKQKMEMNFGANEFWEKHSRQGTPSIARTDMYYHFRGLM